MSDYKPSGRVEPNYAAPSLTPKTNSCNVPSPGTPITEVFKMAATGGMKTGLANVANKKFIGLGLRLLSKAGVDPKFLKTEAGLLAAETLGAFTVFYATEYFGNRIPKNDFIREMAYRSGEDKFREATQMILLQVLPEIIEIAKELGSMNEAAETLG
jgi:hypothetical protein